MDIEELLTPTSKNSNEFFETASEDETPKIALPTLGIGRAIYIGLTLNYSPSFKIKKKVFRKVFTDLWIDMSLEAQKRTLLSNIQSIYLPHCSYIHTTFELTKNGQLHSHSLLEIDQPSEHLAFYLASIRKSALSHPINVYMCKNDRMKIVRSNYIHEVDPVKWLTYMTKDNDKIPFRMVSLIGSLKNMES